MRAAEVIGALCVVRPLLGFRRGDLRAYCEVRRLAFVDDPSNRDAAFLRNRVRHELLPLLEELAPGAGERLARLAEVARGELEVVEAAVEVAWPGVVREQRADLEVDRPAFRRLGRGLQRAVLRRVAANLLGPAPDLSLERLEATREALLGGRGGAVVEWPAGVRLELDGRRGIFRRWTT
jgi:tRNA(Ile)-lysidine synthase